MIRPWKRNKNKVIRHALIMAAGRGMRMLPLTNSIPKPLVHFGNDTLISNGIHRITKAVEFVHITVGYKAATVAQHVIELGVNTVLNTEGKGNAWWIYNTFFKLLDEPIFVLTCDNIVELDFDLISKEYVRFDRPTCMVVPARPIRGLEGDYILQRDNVVFRLDRRKPTESYCSGIQVLNPAKINEMTRRTEDFNSVWRQLISRRQVYCSNVYPKRWFTADTIDQLARLNTWGKGRSVS